MSISKIFLTVISLLSALALTSSAQAGDSAQFQMIGFSRNNAYVAYAQDGIQDGSAFPFATLDVVEVASNKLVLRKKKIVEQEGNYGDEAKVLQALIRETDLAKFGIVAGQNLGLTLFVGYAPKTLQFSPNWYAGRTQSKYLLELTSKPGKVTAKACSNSPELALSLTLKNADQDTKPISLTLQNETRQPKSRQCSYGYSISRVIRSGRSLVVALEYNQEAFEGPDVRSMVVTKSVNLAP